MNNISVKKQVINNNQQNIGFIIHRSELYIYIPNYPTRIIDDIEFININDKNFKKYIQSFQKTKDIFNNIYDLTQNQIPSLVTTKTVVDNSIVGLFTLSNDFVKVIKEENHMDNELKTYYLTSQKDNSYIDPQDLNNIIGKEIDSDIDLNDSKTTKLYNNNKLYDIFKHKVLLTLSYLKKQKVLTNIIKTVNSYNIPYNEQMRNIIHLMRTVTSKTIEFVSSNTEINRTILDSTCSEGCEDFKIQIPRFHLLNNTSNEKGFYEKLADEFLRHKELNSFFKIPKQYITSDLNDYNLNDNEILTFQSFLTSEYINNKDNKIVGKIHNDTFNLSYPKKIFKDYPNEIFVEDIFKGVYHEKDRKRYLTVNNVEL
jgi:hypothetical protein